MKPLPEMRARRWARFDIALVLLCSTSFALGANFQAGVARTVITPQGPIWLCGFARKHPSEGIAQDLWAKALVLKDGSGGCLVLVTLDVIGLPKEVSDAVASRVLLTHGLNRSQLLLCPSHTHSGPLVWPNLQNTLLAEADTQAAERRRCEEYACKLVEQLVSLVEAAFAGISPARLAAGRGSADFAVNRRVLSPEGKWINGNGPVDHNVPVIRVTAPDGKVRAIVFGYACHPVTLGKRNYVINADYAGFAQAELERALPGTTAMFMPLCAGDQNPREAETTLANAAAYGKHLADAVQATLAKLKTLRPPLQTAYEICSLDFAPHSRATFEMELHAANLFARRRAVQVLKAYDAGHPPLQLQYPIQVVRWGSDLTLIALSGEPVVDYSLRLKREHPGENLIVAGYANEVMCYIPSRRILRENGYEAEGNMMLYGQPGPLAETVEETIIAACKTLLKQTGRNTGATAHYVAPSGADTNPGTKEKPFAGIQRGATACKPGDTLYIRAGTYHEQVRIRNSGAGGAPIHLQAYPGERPVLDGGYRLPAAPKVARTDPKSGKTFVWGALFEVDASYIVVDGLEVTRSLGAGIAVLGRANHNKVRNCEVRDNRGVGVMVLDCSDNLIENCRISGSGNFASYYRSPLELDWPAGLATRRADGVVLRGNTVFRNWGEGILPIASTHMAIEDNVVYDNMALGIYCERSSDILVQRNLVYNTNDPKYWRRGQPCIGIMVADERQFAQTPQRTARITIVNNLVAGHIRNFAWASQGDWALQSGGLRDSLIAFNTFVEAQSNHPQEKAVGVKIDEGVHNNARIQNNIILQTTGLPALVVDDTNLHFSHNVWSIPVSGRASGPGDVVADPKLIGPFTNFVAGEVTSGRFRLLENSPAIGRASPLAQLPARTDFRLQPRDTRPNCGAIEVKAGASE